MKKLFFTGIFIFALNCIFSLTAPAATFTVDRTDDDPAATACTSSANDCSLRGAISRANSETTDDTINFDPAAFTASQTIRVSGTSLSINLSGTLLIDGTGLPALYILTQENIRVLWVMNQAVVTLKSLFILNGRGNSNPNFGFGGCILNNGYLTLTDSQVNACSADISGGAIASTPAAIGFPVSLTLNNSRIASNKIGIGGGGSRGGGIFSAGGTTINGSVITGNSAESGAGGGIASGVSLNINNSVISGNSTVQTGSFSIGGGIINEGTAIITNSKIQNNSSQGSGGGINSTATNSFLTLTNSTVSGNRVNGGGQGSGIAATRATVTGSTISGNTGTNTDGGGLYIFTQLSMTNSTVSRNTGSRGGGIYSAATVSAQLTNSTVAYNTATIEGGGLYTLSSNQPTAARNTIFANNTASSNPPATVFAPDIFGNLNSQGYNLIKNTSGANISGTTTGNITGIDPRIDPVLRNNGGQTQTHALFPLSIAIDTADPANSPATDQRGFVRPGAGSFLPDIGAYERQADGGLFATRFDFDGDGRADISVFRPTNGAWYINRSTGGFKGELFGFGTDLPVPADFDGDGKADIAVFRDGNWYYLRSSDNGFAGTIWGSSGEIPLPADYDGDGLADVNVFRPSNGTWYRRNTSNGQFAFNAFGQNGDKPLIGDFNGDGKADIAVFRPSTGSFYIARPTGIPAQNFDAVQFGISTDIPVPADYDGDGKTDIAVFRPSNGGWYRLNSSTGEFVGVQFGLNGDIPTPADYDGDGKADIAVFRNGNWYYLRSSDGAFYGEKFGLDTDKPLPAAFQQ